MKVASFEQVSQGIDNKVPYYSIYSGKSSHYFNGRVVLGYKVYPLIVNFCMINSGLFYYYFRFIPYFDSNISFLYVTTVILLNLISDLAMIITAIGDPGCIPRINDFNYTSEEQYLIPVPTYQSDINWVLVGTNEAFLLELCETCRTYQTPRTGHCRRCDNCVQDFDHHCKWLGVCVARRNYRSFMVFVISLSIMLIMVAAHMLKSLEFNLSGEVITIIIIDLGFGIFTNTLLLYHIFLIFNNFTTLEHLKTPRFIQKEINEYLFSGDRPLIRRMRFMLFSLWNRLFRGIREPFIKFTDLVLSNNFQFILAQQGDARGDQETNKLKSDYGRKKIIQKEIYQQ